jgi:hypothetical protein
MKREIYVPILPISNAAVLIVAAVLERAIIADCEALAQQQRLAAISPTLARQLQTPAPAREVALDRSEWVAA